MGNKAPVGLEHCILITEAILKTVDWGLLDFARSSSMNYKDLVVDLIVNIAKKPKTCLLG